MDTHNTQHEEVSSDGVPVNRSKRTSSSEALFGMLLFSGVVLFFLVIVSYLGWHFYGNIQERKAENEGSSIVDIPRAQPKTDEVVSETASSEKKEESKSQEPTSESVNKKIALKILNGGAAKGSAATYALALTKAGYSSVTTGNSTGDYTGISIYYAQGGTKADAEAVKLALSQQAPKAEVKAGVSGNTDTSSSAITVIVGK